MVVMPSVTFKSIPASLHRALKAQATRHNRSLNSEVLVALEKYVQANRPVDIEALLAREATLLAKMNVWATPEEIDRFKREGRDA